jgi:hypothetical protein
MGNITFTLKFPLVDHIKQNMGVRINAYRVVVRSVKEGDHLSRHRWEDNTKKDLEEVEWEVVDWIDLA